METEKVMEFVIRHSIDRASQALSKILRAGARIELEYIDRVDISKWSEQLIKKDETDMIGTMISLKGNISSKFLFLIRVQDAFIFTDLMLRNELGTTKNFDNLTKSAVQEISNILSGSIANTLAKDFNLNLWPVAPVTMYDYLGAIFSNFVVSGAATEDTIWLIHTKFYVVRMQIECELFLVMDSKDIISLKKIFFGEKNENSYRG